MRNFLLKITYTDPSYLNWGTDNSIKGRMIIGGLILFSSLISGFFIGTLFYNATGSYFAGALSGVLFYLFSFFVHCSFFAPWKQNFKTWHIILRLVLYLGLFLAVSIPTMEIAMLRKSEQQRSSTRHLEKVQIMDKIVSLKLKEEHILESLKVQDSLVSLYSEMYLYELTGIKSDLTSGKVGEGPMAAFYEQKSKNYKALQTNYRKESDALKKEIGILSSKLSILSKNNSLDVLEMWQKYLDSRSEEYQQSMTKLFWLLQFLFSFLFITPGLMKLSFVNDEYSRWQLADFNMQNSIHKNIPKP